MWRCRIFFLCSIRVCKSVVGFCWTSAMSLNPCLHIIKWYFNYVWLVVTGDFLVGTAKLEKKKPEDTTLTPLQLNYCCFYRSMTLFSNLMPHACLSSPGRRFWSRWCWYRWVANSGRLACGFSWADRLTCRALCSALAQKPENVSSQKKKAIWKKVRLNSTFQLFCKDLLT